MRSASRFLRLDHELVCTPQGARLGPEVADSPTRACAPDAASKSRQRITRRRICDSSERIASRRVLDAETVRPPSASLHAPSQIQLLRDTSQSTAFSSRPTAHQLRSSVRSTPCVRRESTERLSSQCEQGEDRQQANESTGSRSNEGSHVDRPEVGTSESHRCAPIRDGAAETEQ